MLTLTPKERMTKMLADECKIGKLEWYYISVADSVFLGGYFIQAVGPTDAWHKMHILGYYIECGNIGETQTSGPIPEEFMTRVPEAMRWRRLNRQEAEGLK